MTIPMIYCMCGNIVNFSHKSRIRFSFADSVRKSIQTKGPKKPAKPLLLLGSCRPPSNTSMPGPTPLITPNGSSIGSRTFAQICHKLNFPFVTMGCPTSTPKLPIPIRQTPTRTGLPWIWISMDKSMDISMCGYQHRLPYGYIHGYFYVFKFE